MLPNFNQELLNEAKVWALQKPDREQCGLVIVGAAGLIFVPSPNVSKSPTANFCVDTEIWEEYEDLAIAVFHSHPHDEMGGGLTPADINSGRSLGMGALLYHNVFDIWDYWHPDYWHPYPLQASSPPTLEDFCGWPFEYGRADCWSVARGALRELFRQDLPDYPRGDFSEIEDPSFTPFLNGYGRAGLESILDRSYTPGDLLILRLGGLPNHCALVVEHDGQLQLLHHIGPGTLSRIEPIERYLRVPPALHLRRRSR